MTVYHCYKSNIARNGISNIDAEKSTYTAAISQEENKKEFFDVDGRRSKINGHYVARYNPFLETDQMNKRYMNLISGLDVFKL
jgi:hypothetical protein